MIKDIHFDEKLKKIITNEIKNRKESATYLIVGSDHSENFEVAKIFAKALNCLEMDDDFCGKCDSCLRIESSTHGDLEILENIGIDDIRELSYKASRSSYEENNKIFILKNLERLNKESLNSMLKTIEEPSPGNYFFLLSNSLNILPTIKSRSIVIRVPMQKKESLGVSQEVFQFFLGNSRDILMYKESKINLDEVVNYLYIGEIVKNYIETRSLTNKVEMYKALRYFVNSLKNLSTLDKINFIEELVFAIENDKSVILEILNYIGNIRSNNLELEKILETKKMLHLYKSMNIKGLLMNLFL